MKSTPRRPWSLQRTTRIALTVLLVLSHPLWAATIIVDETTCTLVEAITAANTDTATGGCPAGSAADTIELTANVSLTEANNSDGAHANGLPIVESVITVNGGGFTITRDHGAPMFRLLKIDETGALTLNNVTLTNGSDGAILNHGNLALTNSTVSDNSGWAGIHHAFGILTLTNSTVSGNTSPGSGGGIFTFRGSLTLTNSTVRGNSASGSGGGIHNTMTSVYLTNSTVSGNSAAGCAIYTYNYYGGLSLENSTVAGNLACGIFWSSDPFYSYPVVRNSIIASNSDVNCFPEGQIFDGGNNFADDNSCGAGFADITPDVDFDLNLADNGGPTLTHALLPGSTAIDAAGDCDLETDQRGQPRNDDACDSGCYEFQCSITVTKDGVDTLIWFTPDSSEFDVAAGYLSDLQADDNFSQAECLGTYSVSPAVDTLPEPAVGDGRYYVARGLTSCVGAHYGDSSLTPDPRDGLVLIHCP